MSSRRKIILSLATALLVTGILAVGCSPVQANENPLPGGPGDQNRPSVSSPETARDRILSYLRQQGTSVPSPDDEWQGGNISSENTVVTDNYLYTYEDWAVSVVSPDVAPENRVFMVGVVNEQEEFRWAGLVDAYGQVTRMDRLQVTLPAPTVLPTSTLISFPTLPPPTTTPSFFTPTPIPVPCSDAAFLEGKTVADGTTFPQGGQFLMEWRVRNVGTCTWSTEYNLIFVGGNRMRAEQAIPLAEIVRPGEVVELGAYMFAPQAPGTYRGFWMLRNAEGERFGIGDDAGDSFWVEIVVVGETNQYKYNFALEYCSAIWRTAVNRISCGDEDGPRDGFVQFLISPELENRHENESTLWLHPNESRDGWIEGTYPPLEIQSGDHFRAWVGCLGGYELCDVTFYLAYIGGDDRIATLGTWHEVYDNQVSVIDIDLSNLAGESVQFILGMEPSSANVSSAQGFWFVPRIQRQ